MKDDIELLDVNMDETDSKSVSRTVNAPERKKRVASQNNNIQQKKKEQSLAKEVFRFHVIAESDSANDQRIKLKVRDAVLKYMKAHMTRAERRDAKATKAWTLTHKKELTDTADKILKKEKVSYRAKAEVTTCYFPDKRYG